jgi:5-hydroxyisourate hydrolase
MQYVILSAFFVIQHQGYGDARAVRPCRIGRVLPVTVKIARIAGRDRHGCSFGDNLRQNATKHYQINPERPVRSKGGFCTGSNAMLPQTRGRGMGKLTTHVLDTARGKPAAGVAIWLYRVTGNSHKKIAEVVTNSDGRTDGPMLEGAAVTAGQYELVFHAGDYLRATGQASGEVIFLDQIPIRFGITDSAAHYHVPLLISPFAYSTYRGS